MHLHPSVGSGVVEGKYTCCRVVSLVVLLVVHCGGVALEVASKKKNCSTEFDCKVSTKLEMAFF